MVTTKCDICEVHFDSHDGGKICNACDKAFCPKCEEKHFANEQSIECKTCRKEWAKVCADRPKECKSTHFFIGWRHPYQQPFYGEIYCNGLEFAGCWRTKADQFIDQSDPRIGKWVLNRHGLAIDEGCPVAEKYFDTPEALLQWLEEWLDKSQKDAKV